MLPSKPAHPFTIYPYNDLNSALRREFGERVQKISIDAGLSCPNRDGHIATGGCTYCNARGSGTGAGKRGRSVGEQLRDGMPYLSRRYKAEKFIAYFQSFTNTHAPVPVLKALYDEALANPRIVGMNIGTRPDCVPDPVLDLLQMYAKKKMVWVEYGLQSIWDDTLCRINRGHDFSQFADAVERTQSRGIRICAHIILGLPGENRQMMLQTARTLSAMNVDGVKIHLLYIAQNTSLAADYHRGAVKCLDRKTYVELVCDILEILSPQMIIHRLTGDPHSDELIAPAWALDKNTTMKMIRQTLNDRHSWQGRHRGE